MASLDACFDADQTTRPGRSQRPRDREPLSRALCLGLRSMEDAASIGNPAQSPTDLERNSDALRYPVLWRRGRR